MSGLQRSKKIASQIIFTSNLNFVGELKLHVKFQNPGTSPSGRKVTESVHDSFIPVQGSYIPVYGSYIPKKYHDVSGLEEYLKCLK